MHNIFGWFAGVFGQTGVLCTQIRWRMGSLLGHGRGEGNLEVAPKKGSWDCELEELEGIGQGHEGPNVLLQDKVNLGEENVEHRHP